MDWEKLFLDELPLIERTIASVCRSKGCHGDEKEEFTAVVKLKLLEDDYRRLRQFEGRSSLSTFLRITVVNLFRDFRIEKWGKFRTSAAAQRLGWEAEQLEILRERDGFSDEEAIRQVLQNHHTRFSRSELEEILARLPPRTPRRFTGEEELASLGSDGQVEERLRDRELGGLLERFHEALGRALATIADEEDRMMLKMHYRDGFTWTAISQALQLPRRQLYGRKDACLKRLRRALEEEGWPWERVRELLAWARGSVGLKLIDDEA